MAKTVIVTGASRGIGRAIALYLIRASYNVLLLARSEAPLEELRKHSPKQVRILTGDTGDLSLAGKAIEYSLKEFGTVDGLILNHGTLDPVGRVAEADPNDWRKAFDVNFFSLVAFVTAALPSLRKSKGRIIFTSSGAAINAYTGWGAYGATKAAMNHLALTLGVEEPDVTTIAVRPGVVNTDMQQDIREKHSSSMQEKDVARFHQLHKDGGLLRPEQPGHVIAKLVLEGPKDLSGKFLSWNDKDLSNFQET